MLPGLIYNACRFVVVIAMVQSLILFSRYLEELLSDVTSCCAGGVVGVKVRGGDQGEGVGV